MSLTLIDVPQRSPQWFAARAGILTASVVKALYATGRTKGSESTARRDLRFKLALERISGTAIEEAFQGNADTDRGITLEAEALGAYEAKTGQMVMSCGFVRRDDLPIGCSPDAVVYDGGTFEGGVDVKCPRPANHDAYRCDPSLLIADYEAQIAHTLLVTGAPWWDLASYCPQMPEPLRLVIVRLCPMKAEVDVPSGYASIVSVDVAAHELNVRQFLREVDAKEADLRQAAEEIA